MATHSIENGFISFKEDYRENEIVLSLLQKVTRSTDCNKGLLDELNQGGWNRDVKLKDFEGDFNWYVDVCHALSALVPYLSSGEVYFVGSDSETGNFDRWKMTLVDGAWEEYDGRVVYDDNLFVDVPDRALLDEVERRGLNAK